MDLKDNFVHENANWLSTLDRQLQKSKLQHIFDGSYQAYLNKIIMQHPIKYKAKQNARNKNESVKCNIQKS